MAQTWDKSEIPHCSNCKSLLTRLRGGDWHCHLCGTAQEDGARDPITPTLVSAMHDQVRQCLRDDRGQCCVYELARQAAGWIDTT